MRNIRSSYMANNKAILRLQKLLRLFPFCFVKCKPSAINSIIQNGEITFFIPKSARVLTASEIFIGKAFSEIKKQFIPFFVFGCERITGGVAMSADFIYAVFSRKRSNKSGEMRTMNMNCAPFAAVIL